MPIYQTTNPLARTNPLRSIPLIRPAAGIIPRSDQSKAEWALAIARRDVPLLEQRFAVHCAALGAANRTRKGQAARARSLVVFEGDAPSGNLEGKSFSERLLGAILRDLLAGSAEA